MNVRCRLLARAWGIPLVIAALASTPPAGAQDRSPDAVRLVSADDLDLLGGPLDGPFAQSYPVGELLDAICQRFDQSRNEARQTIQDYVRAAPLRSSDNITRAAKIDRLNERPTELRPPSSSSLPDMRWEGDYLVVLESPSGHRRVARQLADLEKSGLNRLVVVVQFIFKSHRDLDALPVEWHVLGPEDEDEDVDNATELAGDNATDQGLATAGEGDSPTPRTPVRGRVRSLVESYSPARLAIAAETAFEPLLPARSRASGPQVIRAPKLSLLSGQWGLIEDVSQNPFAVAGDDARSAIRMFTEGSRLRIRPTLAPGGEIRLDVTAVFRRIQEVKAVAVGNADGGEPTRFQAPTVASLRIESTVEMAPGQALLIAGCESEAPSQTPDNFWRKAASRVGLGGKSGKKNEANQIGLLISVREEKEAE